MTLVLALTAYLLGSIPFGYLIVKITEGRDIRSTGSGNIGATNVLRTSGRVSAIVTLLLDAAKGYLAVWIAGWVTARDPRAMAFCAVAVTVGHMFPVYLKFKGGKGVATGLGVFLCLALLPVLATLVIFIAAAGFSRYASLGSIAAAVVFPFLYYFWEFVGEYPQNSSLWLLSAVVSCSALIIFKHHENIRRLAAGTERKLGKR